MKNLIHKKEVNNLPKKESMRLGDEKCDYGGYPEHPVDGIWPRDRVNYLCERNIGKPFDYVFSKFCSQVPVYQQHCFLDELRDNPRFVWGNTYYVDDNGLIQKTERKKTDKEVYFYSDDYKTDHYDQIVEGYKLQFSSKNDPTYKRLIADQDKRKRAIYRKIREEEDIEI